jgi:hypothetical protein
LLQEHTRRFVRELGIVVGGILVKPLGEAIGGLGGIRDLEPDDFFERIAGSGHRLAKYYVGYDAFEGSNHGFDNFFDEEENNQVRHFIGGLASAYFYGSVATRYQLNQEDSRVDRNLYRVANSLAATLRGGQGFHIGDGGHWVLRNLADDTVQQKHGIPPWIPLIRPFLEGADEEE